MKKILSMTLVCVLLIGVMLTFTSCGTILFGEYESELLNTTIEFKLNKFTMTTEVPFLDDIVKTGTYKITGEDGEREITFIYEEDGEEKEDTYSFSEMEKDGEKYIVIGGFNYEKED